jgi:hypothetical protein
MGNQDKTKQLENQLASILTAYNILEEYCCLLVGGDLDDNETISKANMIVSKALNNIN